MKNESNFGYRRVPPKDLGARFNVLYVRVPRL